MIRVHTWYWRILGQLLAPALLATRLLAFFAHHFENNTNSIDKLLHQMN